MIFKNNRPNQIPDINFHSKTFNNRTLTYKPTKNSSTTITQLFTITNPKTKLSNESRVHYTFNCIKKKKLESNQCDHRRRIRPALSHTSCAYIPVLNSAHHMVWSDDPVCRFFIWRFIIRSCRTSSFHLQFRSSSRLYRLCVNGLCYPILRMMMIWRFAK